MFAQNFESESPNYWTPEEFPFDIEPPFIYNPYLVVPPRIYAEEIAGLVGAFVRKEQSATGHFTLHLIAQMNVLYAPSYDWQHWWFDGATGALLGRERWEPPSLHDVQIFQMRDGGLWRQRAAGGLGEEIYELDQATLATIPGSMIEASHFGGSTMSCPLVDRAENLFVGRAGSLNSGQIGVFDLTTGALIRTFNMPGEITHLLPEDARRAYAISNQTFTLIDYVGGEILSVLHAPPRPEGATPGGYLLYAWDRFFRRILMFAQMPLAENGAETATFRGFYPVPLGVGLTDPIPLIAPRAGRRTPFLTKVYGDAGEAITGVKIVPSAEDAALVGTPPFTDSDGEALVILTPAAAGSDTLEVSAEV